MQQTEEFKDSIAELKKIVKVSSVLKKSSTYMKITGVEFNGEYYGNLTDLDKRRLKEMGDLLKKLGQEIHENIDK
jgi:hypothetical protein